MPHRDAPPANRHDFKEPGLGSQHHAQSTWVTTTSPDQATRWPAPHNLNVIPRKQYLVSTNFSNRGMPQTLATVHREQDFKFDSVRQCETVALAWIASGCRAASGMASLPKGRSSRAPPHTLLNHERQNWRHVSKHDTHEWKNNMRN